MKYLPFISGGSKNLLLLFFDIGTRGLTAKMLQSLVRHTVPVKIIGMVDGAVSTIPVPTPIQSIWT